MKPGQRILNVLMVAGGALCPVIYAVAYHQWMAAWGGLYYVAMGLACVASMVALITGRNNGCQP